MKLLSRDICAVTKACDLEPLYDFKGFPVFMGCTDKSVSSDLKLDMCWAISLSSGLIQLDKLIPLDILYPESHGAGEVGSLWAKHHEEFANFVDQLKPSSVLEIGGAHGILANEYHKISNIPWTILEPNPAPVDGCKATFIKGFFNESFEYNDQFDTIVHSHVFEHIYNPDDFVHHLSNFMSPGKKLVFSLPNMQVMLERKYNNCINFEHTVFLTEPYVEYLLAKHGFKLLTKAYFMDDHSIFYSYIRDAFVTPIRLTQGLYEKNKKLYLSYIDYHHKLIADLNQKINNTSQPIFLFGAHVFAQYLLNFGLNANSIINILDNDPNKQGKRLYGTSLNVESPSILKGIKDPLVILKAGVYNTEIKKDILGCINSNVNFLE